MSVWKAVSSRKSVRAFLDKPISQEKVRDLLEKASRSPSGGNTQPWHVYVVTGDVKRGLEASIVTELENGNVGETPEFNMYPPECPDDYMKKRRKLAGDMFKLMGIDYKDMEGRMKALQRNYVFFDAPIGILITVDRVVDRNGWGHVGMFLQTLALLAEDEGLATCFEEAWANFPRTVYRQLNIPESEMLWCGIALGYEDKQAAVNQLTTERDSVDKFAKFLGFPNKL